MRTSTFRHSVAVILLLVVSLLVTGCATDRAVIGQANQFHSGLDPAVMKDRELSDYLNRVGQRIIESAKLMDRGANDNAWMFSRNMQFHLVNSKTLNAFTTGGEHMYIYNELFQQARTEDELAAVMAHEYAHVYGRHVHKGMNRQMGIIAAAAAAGGAGYLAGGDEHGKDYAGYAAGATMLAGQFVGMSYTRGDESEADAKGFDFYVWSGWDPNRFGDFFQAMIDKGYDKGPEFLSDHPSLRSRVETAKRRAAELPPSASKWRQAPVANTSEFRRLQARAAAVGRTMPTDESLRKTQQLLAAMPRSCLTPSIQEDQKKAEMVVMRDIDRAKRRQQKRAAK